MSDKEKQKPEEAKHTPGPWKVIHSESKNAFNVIGTRIGLRYKIARCPYLVMEESIPPGEWRQLNDREKSEAEANAKLIAEAPEMQSTINQLREENEMLKAELYEEKISTNLLHEGMKTDELRGVMKGAEESSQLREEIKQLKEENEELSLYKHACNESIAHLHRENDIFKRLIDLAYAAGVAGVGWNDFQDKHNL